MTRLKPSYKRAIELEPDNEDYYFSLSEMFHANEELEKAIEVLEEGLIENPDSASHALISGNEVCSISVIIVRRNYSLRRQKDSNPMGRWGS